MTAYDCQTANQIWFSRFGEWFIRNTNQINRIDCVLDPESIHAFLRGSMTPASLLRCFPVLALDPSHAMSTSVFGARLKALQAETKMFLPRVACISKRNPCEKLQSSSRTLAESLDAEKLRWREVYELFWSQGDLPHPFFLALKLPPCSWLHGGPMSKLENCSAQSPKSQFLSLQTIPRH